jgi:hypothetical protein
MKKTLIYIVLLLFVGVAARAQAPQALNYQGVARDGSGFPLASTLLGMRLSVHDGSPSGTIVYQETQAPTTNSFGLYNVAIGNGTPVTGTLAGVDWSSGSKYLQVEIDPAGGTAYVSAGISQLLSVPYAIYANTANTANSATTAGSVTGGITGSGTVNTVPKFTAAAVLGNSNIFDNGANVGVNTITPTTMSRLNVSGVGVSGALPYYQAGIVADGSATSASASGVFGSSGWRGVFGYNSGTATGVEAIGTYGLCEGGSYTASGYGVKGVASGTGPNNYGVYGTASGATTANYAIYGSASGSGYAGYFSGNLHITGTLSKGSGTFMIDHPLDPENKYLYHSFVESPDMMNIYNGNVVTDAHGVATVTLPDYFDALNKDFRYQLTTLGQPSQVYISKEIAGNQFEITSDKPNVKVSWQVTGVRQDKFANAHRVVPEVEKEQRFKGLYLHAAEWGMPASKSIDAVTNGRATVDNK